MNTIISSTQISANLIIEVITFLIMIKKEPNILMYLSWKINFIQISVQLIEII